MKSQEGVVVEVAGKACKIRVGRHSNCSNCGSCPGDSALILDAQNPIGAKAGQRVLFEQKENNMLWAAFVVYMLPIIAAFAGVFIGKWIGEKAGGHIQILEIIGGIIAFILSLLYIKYIDKSTGRDSSKQPVIVQIL